VHPVVFEDTFETNSSNAPSTALCLPGNKWLLYQWFSAFFSAWSHTLAIVLLACKFVGEYCNWLLMWSGVWQAISEPGYSAAYAQMAKCLVNVSSLAYVLVYMLFVQSVYISKWLCTLLENQLNLHGNGGAKKCMVNKTIIWSWIKWRFNSLLRWPPIVSCGASSTLLFVVSLACTRAFDNSLFHYGQ